MSIADPSFEIRTYDGGHVVTVSGEIDIATAPQLAEVLAQFADGDVIVDVAMLEFIDSSGLNALVAAHRHIARRRAQLLVHNPPPAIAKLIQVTGLDEVLNLNGEAMSSPDMSRSTNADQF